MRLSSLFDACGLCLCCLNLASWISSVMNVTPPVCLTFLAFVFSRYTYSASFVVCPLFTFCSAFGEITTIRHFLQQKLICNKIIGCSGLYNTLSTSFTYQQRYHATLISTFKRLFFKHLVSYFWHTLILTFHIFHPSLLPASSPLHQMCCMIHTRLLEAHLFV